MLSLAMKSPVQGPFGKASCLLTCTPLLLNTPFPSYHIPVTLVPSLTYPLFFVTALPQPAWNQRLPHSFYRHGGGPLQNDTSFFSHLPQKRTNHEPATTQLQLGHAGQ